MLPLRRLARSPALRLGLLALAAFAALLFLAGPPAEPAPVQAQQAAWDGIVPPGLSAGTKYRILFVTSGTDNATSSNITTYNTFVQDQADGATGDPFNHANGTNITFKVLGSTEAVDARDNTETNPSNDGTGEAIFYYKGEKVADNYAGLYNGTWDSQAARDQNGGAVPDNVLVFTGTAPDGTEKFSGSSSNAFGRFAVRVGKPDSSGDELDAISNGLGSGSRPFYALSEVLTVSVASQVLVLVSNTGQTTSTTSFAVVETDDYAQGFTTGTHTSGYELTDIGLELQQAPAEPQHFTVSLWSENSGEPGSKLLDLTNPANIRSGIIQHFAAPGTESSRFLDASTTYFVAATYSGGEVQHPL